MTQSSIALGELPLHRLTFYVESYFRDYYPQALFEYNKLKAVAEILTERMQPEIINKDFIIDQIFIKYKTNSVPSMAGSLIDFLSKDLLSLIIKMK